MPRCGMGLRDDLIELWPLFGLEVRTPRLSLHVPDDGELAVLARLSDDIHPPDRMPFTVPWSIEPPDVRHPAFLQHHWGRRAAWTPEAWGIDFAVIAEGELVGCQHIGANGFAEERTVITGSWLHRPRQGQGLGREMRAAILHLAFAGLGAERATSSAYVDNLASQRVSEAVGYTRTGEADEEGHGMTRRRIDYGLERSAWEEHCRSDITIAGLDRCRALFGA